MHSVLLGWLAALFAVMAAMLTLTALVVGWPILLLAVPLAGVAYLFWYHATGRLEERLRQQARQGGRRVGSGQRRRRRRATAAGFGADDDPEWRGARASGAGAGGRGGFGPRARVGGRGGGRRQWNGDRSERAGTSPNQRGMSPDRARGVLGVRADADPEAVREAYREKVKEAHPDRGGSTEAFKRVNEAYEALESPA